LYVCVLAVADTVLTPLIEKQLAAVAADTLIVALAVTFAADVTLGATVNVFTPTNENDTGQLFRLLQAVICVPLSFQT
jgi:uncharacterized membrane protein